MTRKDAIVRAKAFDHRTQIELDSLMFDRPEKTFTRLRAYLYRRSQELQTNNNVAGLLKLRADRFGKALIVLGPAIDKGPSETHFRFDSGARLSFGLTFRERDSHGTLVSFRFHYELPEGHLPRFLRFDLNEGAHTDPLNEPRCHLHPGMEDVRISMPLHDPFEILDKIFFVIEPNLGIKA